MKQSSWIRIVLVLLAAFYPRPLLSYVALKETDNVSVTDLAVAHINSNIPSDDRSSDNQNCYPTPDFLGEVPPGIRVGRTTTASREQTSAIVSTTQPSVTTTNTNCTLCNISEAKDRGCVLTITNRPECNTDDNTESVATAVSTELRHMKDEILNISETVDMFYAFLTDLNNTVQAVRSQNIRGLCQGTCTQGRRKTQPDESFSFRHKLESPSEGMSDGCPHMFRRFYGRKKDVRNDKGTCLWFSNITGSWAEAFVYCNAMGSHLAMLSNWILHTHVSNYMREHVQARFYYLGGTDYQEEGEWRWLKPKKNFPHRLWKKGQPDNKKYAEHCLAIGRYTRKYKWSDVQCDKRLHFICQRKPLLDA